MKEFIENNTGIDIKAVLTTVVPVLITFLICAFVIKLITNVLKKILKKSKIEKSLHTFIEKTIKIVLYFLTILIIADMLGIPMTSLIATFSVVGLAASLAIQDTLSNLASGVTILATHPFKAGDFVDAGGTSGIVRDINLTHTILKTPDNKVIHVPNKQVVNAIITNYSEQAKRRVDITFNLSYNASADKIKEIMNTAIMEHPKILKDEDIFVKATEYAAHGIDYTLRVWVKSADYWDVYFDLMERLKKDFDSNKIEIPYNQLDVHVHNS